MPDIYSAKIAVIDMGIPSENTLLAHGKFSDWFIRAFDKVNSEVKLVSRSVSDFDSTFLADTDGVILTGAEEAVYKDLPWRKTFDPVIKDLFDKNIPVLGVCFAHQYLTDVLGGTVEHSPENREIGMVEVVLTDEGKEDTLFRGISNPAQFLAIHEDRVTIQAPCTYLLAYNDNASVQAFRFGDKVWGVQFHPEVTAEISRTCINKEDLDNTKKEQLIENLSDEHDGLQLLENFARIVQETIRDGS